MSILDFDKEQPSAWKKWNPGLDNDKFLLKQVYDTLPGNDPEQINYLVKIFENPCSPVAFKGAISLPRHDCVHILLGRGLLPQDEAFVIGFTMGTSKSIGRFQSWIFGIITRYLYPHPYKFDSNQVKVLRMAIEAGRMSRAEKIYEFPLENRQEFTLGEIRKMMGIDVEFLKAIYRREKEMIPNSAESKRLPV